MIPAIFDRTQFKKFQAFYININFGTAIFLSKSKKDPLTCDDIEIIFFKIPFISNLEKKNRKMSAADRNENYIETHMPFFLWPSYMQTLVQRLNLQYHQRFVVVCFLMGNGCPPKQVRQFFKDGRLRDNSAHMHIESLIKTIQENTKIKKWYYYDINLRDCICFDGMQPQLRENKEEEDSRLATLWEKHVQHLYKTEGRYPRLHEQDTFFQSRKRKV